MSVFSKPQRCPCGSGKEAAYCHCRKVGKAGITKNGKRVPNSQVPKATRKKGR